VKKVRIAPGFFFLSLGCWVVGFFDIFHPKNKYPILFVLEIKIMSRDKGRWLGGWVGKCSLSIFYEFVALPTLWNEEEANGKTIHDQQFANSIALKHYNKEENEMENASTPNPSNL
jgi:hypothetical protein